MSIIFRGGSSFSTAAAAGSTVFSMGLPSVASGDLILAFFDPIAKGFSPTTGHGYNFIAAAAVDVGGQRNMSSYQKISAGADAGVISLTSVPYLGTHDLDALAFTFSGVDHTTPIDVSLTGSATTNTSLTATAITTTRDNEMVVAAYLYANNSAFVAPAGMITRLTVSLPNSTFDTMAVCTALQASHGSTGNKVATIGSTAAYAWIMMALNPVITSQPFWNNFTRSAEVDS